MFRKANILAVFSACTTYHGWRRFWSDSFLLWCWIMAAIIRVCLDSLKVANLFSPVYIISLHCKHICRCRDYETHWRRSKMAVILQAMFSNAFIVSVSNKISLTYDPHGLSGKNVALVQIKAWHRAGDKSSSEQMMVSFADYIYIYIPLTKASDVVTQSFDVFFDLCLNKRLSKPWRYRRGYETPSRSLWRQISFFSVSMYGRYVELWLHTWSVYTYFQVGFNSVHNGYCTISGQDRDDSP